MPRSKNDRRILLFVTNNVSKYEEAREILKGFDFRLKRKHLELDEPQSSSIEYVAKQTALLAFEMLRRPLFKEDAGLFIDALNGFPGPYSSYVYSSIGVEGILKLMKGVKNRKAKFKSCVAFISKRVCPRPRIFIGEVKGHIAMKAIGKHGFGFDPIFIPSGLSKTFGQMHISEKNETSHRSIAFRAMAAFLLRNPWVIG